MKVIHTADVKNTKPKKNSVFVLKNYKIIFKMQNILFKYHVHD